jgi:hypothetical protein
MDLKELLQEKGINNIESTKQFVKTEYATIELKEDKDAVLILSIQLKDVSYVQSEEILETLKTYLK